MSVSWLNDSFILSQKFPLSLYHTCSSVVQLRVINSRKKMISWSFVHFIRLLKWNRYNVSILSSTFFIVTSQQSFTFFFYWIPFIMTKLAEPFIKVHWFEKYFQRKSAVKKQLFFKKNNWRLLIFSSFWKLRHAYVFSTT